MFKLKMSENEEIMNYVKQLESRIGELESRVETLNMVNKIIFGQFKKCLDDIIEKSNKDYEVLKERIDYVEDKEIGWLIKIISELNEKDDLTLQILDRMNWQVG